MSEEIIIALIGSGVIAAIVSGLFRLRDKRTDNISKHIVEQREKWREKLRDISLDISVSKNLAELKKATTQLETRINAYGQIKKKDDVIAKYLHEDSHIWAVIDAVDDLEETHKLFALRSSERLTPYKEKLVRYISILLKNDWERSKKEAITASDYWAYFSFAMLFTGLYALYQHFILEKQGFTPDVKVLFVLTLLSIALLFVTKELLKKLIENNAFQDNYSAINVFMYFFLGKQMPDACGKTAKGYSYLFRFLSFLILAMLFGLTAWISISQVLEMNAGNVIDPLLDLLVLFTIFLVPTASWVVIIFKSINSYVYGNTKERKAIEEISGIQSVYDSEVTIHEKLEKIRTTTFQNSVQKVVNYDNFLVYLKTNLIQTFTEAILSVAIAAGLLLFVESFLGKYLVISKAALLSIFIIVFLVAILACLIHARTVINYSVNTVLDLCKKWKYNSNIEKKEIKEEMEKKCFRKIHWRGFVAYSIVGILLFIVIWVYVSYTAAAAATGATTAATNISPNYLYIVILGPIFGFLWNFPDFRVNCSMDFSKIFNRTSSVATPPKRNKLGFWFTVIPNILLVGITIFLHVSLHYPTALFEINPTNQYFIYAVFLFLVYAVIYGIPKYKLFFKSSPSSKLYAFRDFDKKDASQHQ